MKRYELLDCLRGLAAFIVVLYHLSVVGLTNSLMPQGYLAVDFFFVLSGFVIANAYEHVITNGRCTLSLFIRKRMIRLYPMAFAGAAFGLSVLLIKYLFFPDKVDALWQICVGSFLNFMLLPTFWGGAASRHLLFPANGALWSLFFEFLINAIWALVLVRRSNVELAIILVMSAFFLVAQTHRAGTENLGMDQATFFGGLARVIFGFTAGVLIYRWRNQVRAPVITAGNWMLIASFCTILAFPGSRILSQERYDLICAIVAMPAIVWAGVAQRDLGNLGRLSGELSYPLYVMHYPVLLIASGLYKAQLISISPHKLSEVAIVISLIASWLALTLYDKPFRGFLTRWMDQFPKSDRREVSVAAFSSKAIRN